MMFPLPSLLFVCVCLVLTVRCEFTPPPRYDFNPYDYSTLVPPIDDEVFFVETFQNKEVVQKRWHFSQHQEFKDGHWKVGQSLLPGLKGDEGLILMSAGKRHAISAMFEKGVLNGQGNDIVVQFETRFHNGLLCGGGYIKLISSEPAYHPSNFSNHTPFLIMFGPDACNEHAQMKFIMQTQQIDGTWTEHQDPRAPPQPDDYMTHLWTLHIRQDNTFVVYVDMKLVRSGHLNQDFIPSFQPKEIIDDPSDIKPSDWVDNAEIDDPTAVKPTEYEQPRYIPDPSKTKPAAWLDNEPTHIPDPNSVRPAEWDDELDGEWVPTLIPNPRCDADDVAGCGEWKADIIPNPQWHGVWRPPKIPNPAFKGHWKARQIPNPNYRVFDNPSKLLPGAVGVGFELFSMQDQIEIDNIFIDTRVERALEFAEKTWAKKHKFEAPWYEEYKYTSGKEKRAPHWIAQEYYNFVTWVNRYFKPWLPKGFGFSPVEFAVYTGVPTVTVLLLSILLWWWCRRRARARATLRSITDASTPREASHSAPVLLTQVQHTFNTENHEDTEIVKERELDADIIEKKVIHDGKVRAKEAHKQEHQSTEEDNDSLRKRSSARIRAKSSKRDD